MNKRITKQQKFRNEIKFVDSKKFDKKTNNYSKLIDAQEADRKRKITYLKAIDKLDNAR